MTNQNIISKPPFVPNENGDKEIYYPTSDGKPMGETGIHIRLLMELVQTLSTFFDNDKDAYAIGNILMYYEEGNPQRYVVPDVLVVFGIGKEERRLYKTWEEKKSPDVIFEISSRGTWRKDLQEKYHLYQKLGVKEYYIYDPEYDYLPEPLMGFHLINDKFEKAEIEDGRIYSPALNLLIVDTHKTLRLLDFESGDYLPTSQELSNKTAELAKETEELATKTEELESENKRLKAELGKLKKQT